ncbi:S-adenosylmethionine:tRNA ribosyltransferase-isomerase [Algoriphagus sp. NF]|uniref:S-adenosylmethionine:tRNA ribosyltransferase-isomerase n=1 Tax=Algoriphagus sp. NF TaxID=2992756 RepID=UPI00237AEEFF|nr:S-adenosylmethionine:tRNA ribosyltransferase-isomerase [Algoriphagus sp. NF]MCR9081034.1 S-adenosylmethionine:tRNA ribosyltransferase-isomerase [Cyclobacteriaceae bacterium]MDE0559679.1 S-adenosylmethionine:tRNA ribosyltransferase-isomerase [Algoriphagus sp. NF]
MEIVQKVNLQEYEYTLPEERIAKYPLEKRDSSKLLHYQSGKISHHHFFDLPDFLDKGTLLVYNDTKVIPARLIFQRETGARIEIFLLNPVQPTTVIPEIMLSTQPVTWQTMIGNAKKWKSGEILKGVIEIQGQKVVLEAKLVDKENKWVEFDWNSESVPFVDIVESSGEVPLPPYLNRKAEESDKDRYQTVYSEKEGAVAAPTAGLHFTEEVFKNLRKKGIQEAQVTLHVSAGTFQPIKVDDVTAHPMHSEQIHLQKSTIEKLLNQEGPIVAVGTTSVRTLESLYWYGVQLLENKGTAFQVAKLIPYDTRESLPSKNESLQAVLNQMEAEGKVEIMGETEIFIFPGYQFQMIDGLITNFHQPGTTLMLLIGSLIGDDWKKVYQEALDNDYRFLSYGDSSLLWINK